MRRAALLAGLVLMAAVATVGVRLHETGTATAEHPRSAGCRLNLSVSRAMGAARFDFGTTRVDLIGDSYSVGAELASPLTQTWDVLLARRLHWDLHIHGV